MKSNPKIMLSLFNQPGNFFIGKLVRQVFYLSKNYEKNGQELWNKLHNAVLASLCNNSV